MNTTVQNPSIHSLKLQRQDILKAQNIEPGTTVLCEKGLLWLTQPGDYKDYMLKPGDRLTVSKQSNFLIEALSEARISILHNN